MRCLGCMKEFESGNTCPFCGYEVGSAPEAGNHLAPGTMLSGSYLIGRALGSGGFGITYIGWDSRSSRPVAIKEYLPGVFAYRTPGQNSVSCYDRESEKKFKAGILKTIEESNCLARLNSFESVVSVYNCVEENNTVYIIMEYLEGKTLKEILESKGKFTFTEALSIMAPILRALSEVHEENIIHRDVSPDNIFICNDSTVKLIDFGAARDSFSDEKSLSVVLKRGYAPKEQYSGSTMQGPWTDIYACAATLYRMLTGIVPQESLERDIDDKLVPLKDMGIDIPDYAEAAIMHSLAVDYRDRIFSASEFLRRLVDPNASGLSEEKSGGTIHVEYSFDDEYTEPAEEKPVKKKKLPIILGIIAVLLIGAGVFAVLHRGGKEPKKVIVDSGTCGSGVNWELDSSGSLEITGAGRMSAFNSPGSAPWAQSAEKIKKLTVSGGVQNIGKNAFNGCENLGELILSSGIESVDESAFSGCAKLKEVILPESLTVINANAFSDCTELKTVHVPASVISFGEGIFDNSPACICCNAEESDAKAYAASHGVRFNLCEGHKIVAAADESTVLPSVSEETTTSIIMTGMCGAELKWELSTAGVLHISGNGAMETGWKSAETANASAPGWRIYSDKITSITVDEGALSIGSAAFSGLRLVTTVKLPESLTYIGVEAFSGCTALTSVNIPASVSAIDEKAFKACPALTSINLNCTVTAISDGCFAACPALASVTLPPSLTRIGANAFSDCVSLSGITLPPTLKVLGAYAFSNCASLTSLSLPLGVRDIPTACFKGSGLNDFTVPSSVETVGDYAFASCLNLQSVTISSGVAAIGKGAFNACSALGKVVLPKTVTLVGQYAFSDCGSLSFVHVTSALKNIGDSAFANTRAVVCCESLLCPAATYCLKNSVSYEHCNGRH